MPYRGVPTSLHLCDHIGPVAFRPHSAVAFEDGGGASRLGEDEVALVVRGRAIFLGNEGTFELVVEPSGAFRRTIDAPLSDAYAESGTAAWAASSVTLCVKYTEDRHHYFPRTLTPLVFDPNNKLRIRFVLVKPANRIDPIVAIENFIQGRMLLT